MKIKRILPVLLALIICVAYMPVSSYAAGAFSEDYKIIVGGTMPNEGEEDPSEPYGIPYTGSPIEPDIYVVDAQVFDYCDSYYEYMNVYSDADREAHTLDPSTYSVTFKDNIEAGYATVTVTATKGAYKDQTLTGGFSIAPLEFKCKGTRKSNGTVEYDTGVTGLKVKEIYVLYDDFNLSEGSDYSVSGSKIILTDAFLRGKTGFKPSSVKNKLMIDAGSMFGTPYMYFKDLSKISFKYKEKQVYDGKKKTVKPTASGLDPSSDFKVTYKSSKRKAIGEYTFTITAKGDYYIGKKTLKFKIIPKKPSKVTTSRTKTTCTVNWAKVANCSGYQVQLICESDEESDMTSYDIYKSRLIKNKKTVSTKFSKIKKGKYTGVRVRSYKTVKGKKIYSNWKYKWF